jgi:hypothetical protein
MNGPCPRVLHTSDAEVMMYTSPFLLPKSFGGPSTIKSPAEKMIVFRSGNSIKQNKLYAT